MNEQAFYNLFLEKNDFKAFYKSSSKIMKLLEDMSETDHFWKNTTSFKHETLETEKSFDITIESEKSSKLQEEEKNLQKKKLYSANENITENEF